MEFSFRRSVIFSCRLAYLCCSWGYCVLFEGNGVMCQGLLIYYTAPSLIRMFLQTFFCIHVSYKQRNRNSDLPRYISSVIRGQAIFSPGYIQSTHRNTQHHCATCFIHTAACAADLTCACVLPNTCCRAKFTSLYLAGNYNNLILLRARSTFF
jgi:hypothetical protein